MANISNLKHLFWREKYYFKVDLIDHIIFFDTIQAENDIDKDWSRFPITKPQV